MRHMKSIMGEIAELQGLPPEERPVKSRSYGVPEDLVELVVRLGRLPVVNFAAGGIATPADAALMMWLGVDGVFVGSGIFKSEDPRERAEAIVLATALWDDPEAVVEAQSMIDEKKSMMGIDIRSLKPEELLQTRGE